MSEAPAAKLPLGRVFRDTWGVYARHWKLLVPLAALILLPQAIGEGISVEVNLDHLDLGSLLGALVDTPLFIVINLAGEALYAGIIAALVIQWRHGTQVRLRDVVRSIPYVRLIVADVVIAIGIAFGLLLLVLPGILFATYSLLATVLIEIDRAGILEGVRRSASLVRGSFWPVLTFAAVMVLGTEALSRAVEMPFHHFDTEVVAATVAESLFEPFQGVGTVLVALELMAIRGERPRAAEAGAYAL